MEIAAQLMKEWEQFKQENDRRLKEVESKGRADPLLEEKLDKHSRAVGELDKKLQELVAKMNRPGAVPDDGTDEQRAHRKAFAGYVRKGEVTPELNDLQVKLLQVGVDADGGYAVPEELDRMIGTMERDAAPMESEVTVMTSGAETYEKLFDLRGTTSGWVGETDARTETNTATFGQFKPSYGEIYANPFATQKMLDDAFFDVEAWLAAGIALEFAEELDLAIVSGNGTNKPKGILNYTLAATGDASRAYGQIEKLHSGSAGDFDGDDLIDLIHKLKPAYRQNAKWLMAGTTVAKIRKLKQNGEYIWAPGLAAGQPSMLLGYNIIEDENVPAIAAASKSVLFGDFKRAYKLVNVRGIRVLRDPFTAKPKVGFYTTKRVGGGVEDTSAVKVLSLEV